MRQGRRNLLAAWQETVFELYLAEEKIEPEVVENIRSWQHSGFSVYQSVFLPAGDQAGSSIDSSEQTESRELTYVDIDTFLASF